MPLPGVQVTFTDNAAGLGSGTSDGVQLKIGVSSLGTANSVYSLTQPTDVRTRLGAGPLVEAAAYHLASGASSVVLCMPITASVVGSNSAVTAVGTPPTLTLSGNPNDRYDFKIVVTAAGTLNVGKIKISRDGGDNYDPETTVQASVVDTLSGVTLTFAAGSYTTAHSWTFNTTAPSYSTSDLTTALAAARDSGYDFDTIHVVGVAASLANDATKAVTLDGVLQGWEAAGFDVAGMIEVGGAGDGSDDAAVITAFAAVAAPTTGAIVGNIEVVQENGDQTKRPAGFVTAAHLSRVARYENGIATQPMQFVGGALPSVVSLYRDERKTPGLDAARFTTLRSHVRAPGFFVTNAYTLSNSGSDVYDWPNRLVINKAKKYARSTLLNFTGRIVKVNPDGTIQDGEAKRIESRVQQQLKAVLVDSKNAEDVQVTVDRTNNVKLTSTVNVAIRVKAFGYSKYLNASVGFLPLV